MTQQLFNRKKYIWVFLPLFLVVPSIVVAAPRTPSDEDTNTLRQNVIELRRTTESDEQRTTDTSVEQVEVRLRQQQLLEAQKDLLLRSIGHMEDYVEQIKHRSQLITQSAIQQRLFTLVEKQRNLLSSWRERTNNAASLSDIRVIAEDIRTFRSGVHADIENINLLWKKTVILEQLERFETRIVRRTLERANLIDEALQKMERAGVDVSQELDQMDVLRATIQGTSGSLLSLRQSVVDMNQLEQGEIAQVKSTLLRIREEISIVYDGFKQIAISIRAK